MQKEYFDTTYQIYKDEIVGNLLLGDPAIQASLFNEISQRRGIGLKLIHKNKEIQAGQFTTTIPIKTYIINLSDDDKATLSLYSINDIKNPWVLNELILPLFMEVLLLSLGFIFLWQRFYTCLLSPLSELVSNLKIGAIEKYTKIERD